MTILIKFKSVLYCIGKKKKKKKKKKKIKKKKKKKKLKNSVKICNSVEKLV